MANQTERLKSKAFSSVHKNMSYERLNSEPSESFKNKTEIVLNAAPEKHERKGSGRFVILQVLGSIGLFFLKKCWKSCSAAVFVIFVMYWCYGGIIALVLFLFALSGFLFQISDFFLYHPDQPPQSRLYVPLPSLLGLPFESIFLTTSDGIKIHAYFIKQDPSIVSHVPTVLYFHGNAGNIGHRLSNARGFYKDCGFNILLLEYRGYGHSEGVQSEEGLYLDAQAGMRFLLQLPYIDKTKIIIFGRSLGGAVAIDLASHPKLGKHIFVLIVENTFTSIPDIARDMFNSKFIHFLPNWAFKNQFFSMKKIKKVKRPTLLISGLADLIIPPKMMRCLTQECGSPIKRLYPYQDGTHNETWQCYGYYSAISMFVDEILLMSQSETYPGNYNAQGEIY